MTTNKAIILDTETHDLNGLVIQLAYASVALLSYKDEKPVPVLKHDTLFNQMYSIGDYKIDHAAMAVHNILDSDLEGKPHTSTITLPINEGYIIGHNIDYDINAIATSTGVKTSLKPICTLALARMVWPELKSHKLGGLIYHIYGSSEYARNLVMNSHDAETDIRNTSHLLTRLCAALEVETMEQLYALSCKARIPTVMPFGKHKGVKIEDVPRQYMNWFINSDNPDPHVCEAFKQVLYKPKAKKD